MLRPLTYALAGVVALSGCAEVLDIDGIPFADDAAGGAGATGGTSNRGGDGGAGTGAGGMAGGNPSAETCGNGVDDNDDGLIDCEDPLCVTHTCAELAPDGWAGPFALTTAEVPEACPTAFPTESLVAGSEAIDAPPATCGACSCGTPSGVQCAAAGVEVFDEQMCDFLNSSQQVPLNQCFPFPSSESAFTPNNSLASAGSCVPTGGPPTLVPATHNAETRLCEAPHGGGCVAGVCVPVAEAPFEATHCITQTGDVSCPDTGSYTERRLLFSDISDQRSCSTCACSAPQGVNCETTTTFFIQPGCNSISEVVVHANQCTDFEFISRSALMTASASGGSCTPQGGTPVGAATAASPTTVCCTP